jgi:alpha-D-ribose 1-methylphosphonate 5-triphosphate synthase subunit PhnI
MAGAVMTYVAVKGGLDAQLAAQTLLHFDRLKDAEHVLTVDQIRTQMRSAVDQVQSEGSLYDPRLAALALKQAEGDSREAAFILRAFRSTLPRTRYTQQRSMSGMRVVRRISAAFQDVPGGQYLGATRDFTKRLLDFELLEESNEHVQRFLQHYREQWSAELLASLDGKSQPTFPKVIDWLRSKGMLILSAATSDAPVKTPDLTRQPLKFPTSRAMRLQAMARGDTGAMMGFAYSNMRGYGTVHPILGELRVGYVEQYVPHPFAEGELIAIGEVLVTEVEVIKQTKDENGRPAFAVGYGFCFGHNEIKAISMATLDLAMRGITCIAANGSEELILNHIDGIEASGYIAHWKLPHYVDFQTELSQMKAGGGK